jgi:sterol desaturase/sphingolipid hydroxylase (fatty acid hydroxylase superfamily)
MQAFESALTSLTTALPAFGRSFARELVIGAILLLAVLAIERAYDRERVAYVRRRGFLHDVAYFLYYRTGAATLLYAGALFALLERPLAFLDLGLGAQLPAPLTLLLALVIGDFVGYWAHRAQHRYAWLWAFHTTHHSQTELNVFTGARFHPVDALWLSLCAYVPLRVIGGDATMWPWLALSLWAFNMLIHSRIPWSYGPLHRVLVSPDFHAFHHSTLPEHHDRNFSSGIFSVWDGLFGTAVPERSPVPARFGLVDLPPGSLLDTLLQPFRLLARGLPRRAAVKTPACVDAADTPVAK